METITKQVKSWRITDKYPCPKCGAKLKNPDYSCVKCDVKLKLVMNF